jgi:hypothetical protein
MKSIQNNKNDTRMKEDRKTETKKAERINEGCEARIAQISMQITSRTSDHSGLHVCQWSDAFHYRQ